MVVVVPPPPPDGGVLEAITMVGWGVEAYPPHAEQEFRVFLDIVWAPNKFVVCGRLLALRG